MNKIYTKSDISYELELLLRDSLMFKVLVLGTYLTYPTKCEELENKTYIARKYIKLNSD